MCITRMHIYLYSMYIPFCTFLLCYYVHFPEKCLLIHSRPVGATSGCEYGRGRGRAYGLATAARDGWHGHGCSRAYSLATAARGGRHRRGCNREYGLVTAARVGQYDTRAVGAGRTITGIEAGACTSMATYGNGRPARRPRA